jgi:uncharacterized membrane protein YdbT with pleckstrin-like domain
MSSENLDNLIWNKPGLPDRVNSQEDLVLVVREDLVIIATKAVGLFLVFLILLASRTILLGFLDKFGIAVFDLIFFGVNAMLILIFSIIFHNYYLSIQIVTSERIIDVDQRGLFNREVNTLSITNIEDVSYKKSGFWGTLLDFGNVVVQTAGNSGEGIGGKTNGFVFDNVPNPAQVSTAVMALFQKEQHKTLQDAAMLNAQALSQIIKN